MDRLLFEIYSDDNDPIYQKDIIFRDYDITYVDGDPLSESYPVPCVQLAIEDDGLEFVIGDIPPPGKYLWIGEISYYQDYEGDWSTNISGDYRTATIKDEVSMKKLHYYRKWLVFYKPNKFKSKILKRVKKDA